VIDLFPSKQAGIAGMTVSFSITRDIVWPEERSDPKKKSHKKIVLLLIFLVIEDKKRLSSEIDCGLFLPKSAGRAFVRDFVWSYQECVLSW